ncbi:MULTISPECIES: hypothetical protein [Rhodococcus]|uniref:hypothetical protein n=1 Tax=Rhodococcus TaxID=1827 RepID=UPI002955D034|nr:MULTISPECIES: hypothetical protein [Rhodococcus]MDV7244495.1 hypothetical protein [Rhodococcus oxybenzonivorans]MDV7274262.1 hypothetical protein [Rhodococcus oxybenzonivorans]MDV7337852.1 hypothetical protein [Rhodococcus oxybenzonivorans]MDV7345212.1 hypothetical protein [Rhodococcus oxybenzonivorans]MDV8028900.1 hypothetical protein [Rhodococcus sp. IEGM 27]
MNDNVDGFFVDRYGQRKLLELLREVPEIAANLAALIAANDGYATRISFDPKVDSGHDGQPLLWDTSAQDAADELLNELWGWARHVCETRGMEYDGGATLDGVAKWLDRNIIALALTEGSEDAPRSIESAVRKARRIAKTSEPKPYAGSVDQARDAELNATAIERMRCELGDEYAGLTARRIKTLRKNTTLEPIRVVPTPDGDLPVYRLGDVLDAHLSYPARQRKKRVA